MAALRFVRGRVSPRGDDDPEQTASEEGPVVFWEVRAAERGRAWLVMLLLLLFGWVMAGPMTSIPTGPLRPFYAGRRVLACPGWSDPWCGKRRGGPQKQNQKKGRVYYVEVEKQKGGRRKEAAKFQRIPDLAKAWRRQSKRDRQRTKQAEQQEEELRIPRRPEKPKRYNNRITGNHIEQ
ncbi:hypothetical protein BD289DRAFT_443996 [Coniella lustricola]|uniref:Uncharacterized protein n=1 Tax=Coniella lustricola TaxID=2025994 RepID=A0A2T2ZWG9_9PEZI|nr:hypothetical protein BD289DRAFT_443996 [Coniella lustricola]